MKIILITDDKKLGKKDTIVEVADAYARNVLIPKGIAIEVNNTSLNELKQRQEKAKREYDMKVAEAEEIIEKLSKVKNIVKVIGHCSESGKMIGAVTTRDIANTLRDSYNIDVKKQDIALDEHINMLGVFPATIKLFQGRSVKISILVISDKVV